MMIATNELAEHAIRRLFITNASGGRAPLDARKLHRLWKTTGLRRDDLAEGVRSLTNAGVLTSNHEGGNCVYVLSGRPALDSENSTRLNELDQALTRAAARVQSALPVTNLNRRSSDRPRRAPGIDKRVAPRNRLLDALPKAVHALLQPHLQLVPMPLGHMLWEAGDPLDHVCFPLDCIMSLVQTLADGSSSKIAVVGNEGMLSMSGLIAGAAAPTRAIVLHAGFALRLETRILQEEFLRGGPLQRLLLRYSQALLMQVAQTAACNRHHSLEQQVCRLLLESADRLRSRRLTMTHETMSSMLGVRRVGVTEAIGKLKRSGSITCQRGSITLIDRQALTHHSCECYTAVKNEFDRLRPLVNEAGR